MKKLYTLTMATAISGTLLAGGIVTNTNQSAHFVRLLSRNASTQIDAVYFNPAGLVKLDDGFHLAFSNQTILQDKTVTNDFQFLNNHEYVGEVMVPSFPTFQAAYKMDKLVISLGFGPNGGGGSADFSTGLPSFEMPVSMIPPSLAASGIPANAYTAEITFNGSSVYWGTQLNASYAINENYSVAAGVRMINAKNVYEGSLKNIMINPTFPAIGATGSMMSAPTFFTNLSTYLNGASTQAYNAATNMQPLVDGGAGNLTFAQAEGAGAITSAQRAAMEGGLLAMGTPQATIDAMTIAQAQGAYNLYGAGYAESAGDASDNAAATQDMDVYATQTGIAFTPIISAHANFGKLNVGVKYEFNTNLELTNDSEPGKDANGMFKDDSTFRSDIPAILGVGIEYALLENLRASFSWTHYFDKNADWNGKEEFVDKDFNDFAFGLEYDLNKMFTLSAGYMYGKTGVGEGYQSDLSYSNSSSTIGFGGRINLNEKLSIDLGALFTSYLEDSDDKTYAGFDYTQTYDKSLMDFAIGVNYRF